MWTLKRLFNYSPENIWKEIESPNPESAKNDVLNETVEMLGALKVVDVRKKPDAIANCFRNNHLDAELAAQTESLGDFGFSFFDSDPFNLQSINPILVGEGGSIEIQTKDGIKIVLIFGKKFDAQRACLAYATFDRETLAETIDNETEVAFLAPELEKS